MSISNNNDTISATIQLDFVSKHPAVPQRLGRGLGCACSSPPVTLQHTHHQIPALQWTLGISFLPIQL